MKRLSILMLLIFMLLCCIFLHAGSDSKKHLIVENKADEVTHTEVKTDMQFVPNVILF